MTDTHTTPEGFELYRPLLMPDARSFGDVLEYVRDWDHSTMSHYKGEPGPGHIEDLEFEGNRITAFCSVRMDGRHSMAVRPTPALLAALSGQLLPIDDSLAFEVIHHETNNRCLILISHNQIIGSRYLAYVDPSTVPLDAES